MGTYQAPHILDTRDLPLFDGFPYFVTRLAPAIYHLTLLPEQAGDDRLPDLVRAQVRANRLRTALVLAADRAFFFDEEGKAVFSPEPPRGGTRFVGLLAPAAECPRTPDFLARSRRLDAVAEETRREAGYQFGDLTKGGRPATEEELAAFAGTQAGGVPRGLARCARCDEWRGVCLDPSGDFRGMLMPVHCRCENHNRCAGCLHVLYERRLNANFYDPGDGRIWHVPGFMAFEHRCISQQYEPSPGRH